MVVQTNNKDTMPFMEQSGSFPMHRDHQMLKLCAITMLL
jgi:hypothetical protein